MRATKVDEESLQGKEGSAQTSRSRAIPSLDGLRAVAISLVAISHYGGATLKSDLVRRYLFELGHVGVSLFFVISGFLITFLLDKEKEATQKVALKAFYIRRAFRIFPPFYVYILVVLLLWLLGVADEDGRSMLASATYTWNYYLHARGGLLESTWSLSLEEQFYLFWPFCLKFLELRQARWLALWLIVLMPFSRVATALLFPAAHAAGKISGMLHTRLDTMMFGCLLALVWRRERFKSFAHRMLSAWSFQLAWLSAFVALPLLALYLGAAYHFCYLTLSSVALTWTLLYSVRKPMGIAGRFLNTAPLRYIGLVSYSLYLYQQMFTGYFTHSLLLNLGWVAAATSLSFYLIEKPSLALRDRVLQRSARGRTR